MTKLRGDYDPREIPVNSSGIFRLHDETMELQLVDQLPWKDLPETEAQTDYERRQGSRYENPKTAFRIHVQRFLNAIVYRIYANRRWQAGFAAISMFSLGLLWFSATQRIDLIDEVYTDQIALGQVETELLRVRELWSADKMLQIADNVRNADERRVFGDFQGLAVWLRQKNQYADQLGLSFSYSLGEGRSSRIDDMLELPVEVVLTVNEGEQEQTYLRMLEFLRKTVSTLYYAEIVEAALESEGDGVTRTVATLRVWVHGTVQAQ